MDDPNRMDTTIKGIQGTPVAGTGTNSVDNPETNKEPSYDDYRSKDIVPFGTTKVPREPIYNDEEKEEDSKKAKDIAEVQIELP